MHRYVEVADGFRLWAEEIPCTGTARAEPLLLIMGANASSRAWPDDLVARLAERHRVLRYDHRDTGRSTGRFDEHPYRITELAADAVAVLDAFDVPQAHLVGMSMGGLLAQLLLLDHRDRVASAVLFCTGPLAVPGAPPPPGPDPTLLRMWAELEDPRDPAGELAWRVEHWRLLNGAEAPFDPAEFRALEERVITHAGTSRPATAHARMATDGLDRGAELAEVTAPVLVIEAPADPAFPPPNSERLADALGAASLVRIPGMGHAMPAALIDELAAAILGHTSSGPADPRL
ncbi:MAG TPA: alpha/beta hydrolase [Pseudonocardia sp.]|nr:alpha/beta hydrolase [Pseudonocardia sp.]